MMRCKKSWRKFLLCSFAICIILGFGVTCMHATAETAPKVVSTVVSEDSVYVYIRGIDSIQADSVIQIGTTVCPPENISVGKLTDLEVPMRTIILLDNSYSIPAERYEDIKSIVSGILDGALQGEQFRIGTFSDSVTYLCDYTADTVMAISCVEGIEYRNQDTYFSDDLYEILADIKREKAYYLTRVIMISDGADDNELGYTNEEVRALVGESGIPVYTVGIVAKNNNSELETMFAFSRASNAEYYLLDGSIGAAEVAGELSADRDNICIRIKPGDNLADGSYKKILLKLKTESGVAELVCGAEMPFASGSMEVQPEQPTAEDISESSPTVEEKPSKPVKELPTIGGVKEKPADSVDNAKSENKKLAVLVIVLVAGALILIGAVIAVVVLRQKKKNRSDHKNSEAPIVDPPRQEPPKQDPSDEPEDISKTVAIYGEYSSNTIGLWGGHASGGTSGQTFLVLRSLDDPAVVYEKPISDVIHIGRYETDIVLEDLSVSGKHCDIILRGDILYIRDLNSTNGTFYEDMRINEERSIASGSKIRLGQCSFRVELIRKGGRV